MLAHLLRWPWPGNAWTRRPEVPASVATWGEMGSAHQIEPRVVGVVPMTVASTIAEVGTDMDVFSSPRRLAAWAGVAPGNYESAGKPKGAGTRRGNVFFKSAPFAAASAVVRTEGSYYRDKYNRLRARRGPVREIMAIIHKLLIAAFHMLSTGEAVRDLGERYFDQVACKRSTAKLVQRLNNLARAAKLAVW